MTWNKRNLTPHYSLGRLVTINSASCLSVLGLALLVDHNNLLTLLGWETQHNLQWNTFIAFKGLLSLSLHLCYRVAHCNTELRSIQIELQQLRDYRLCWLVASYCHMYTIIAVLARIKTRYTKDQFSSKTSCKAKTDKILETIIIIARFWLNFFM